MSIKVELMPIVMLPPISTSVQNVFNIYLRRQLYEVIFCMCMIELGACFREVTVTFEHQILISSTLSASGCCSKFEEICSRLF